MTRRTERINELLRDQISDILRREVRDPRLGETLISITQVETAQDLSHAKVFVSIMASEEERGAAMKALKTATPFIHRLLRRRIPDIRQIPDLSFRRDDSIERGAHLTQVLNDLARERGDGV